MITKTHIKFAVPTLLGVVAIIGAAVIFIPDDAVDRLLNGAQSAKTTGSAVDAIDRDQGVEIDVDEPPTPVYEGPTSIYIEDGFDPDMAELDLGAAAPPSSGEELPLRLSNHMIQRVFRTNQSELLGCYGQVLATDQSLSGDVEFDFAVHPQGQVAMVKIADSTLRSTEAEDCFVDKARHWDFPATSQEMPARFQISMTFQY